MKKREVKSDKKFKKAVEKHKNEIKAVEKYKNEILKELRRIVKEA